jgi:hypothetical protein
MPEQMGIVPEQPLKQEEIKGSQEQYTEKQREEFYQMIEKKLIWNGAKTIDVIPKELHQYIARRLIDAGFSRHVIPDFDKFCHIDQDTTNYLIEKGVDTGYGHLLVNNISKFQDYSQAIANCLILKGAYAAMLGHSDDFPNLTVVDFRKNKKTDRLFSELESIMPNLLSNQLSIGQIIDIASSHDIDNLLVRIINEHEGLNYGDIANRLIVLVIQKCLSKLPSITVNALRKIPGIDSLLVSFESIIPNGSSRFTVEQVLEINARPKEDQEKTLQILKETPFLGEAFFANRYGIKLVLKYPELDELSKENILLLYDVKKNKSNVEQNTPEFRSLVQERLRSYKKNGKIIVALQGKGVDTEEWLNYQERIDFDLGKEDETSFAQRIHLPITRLTGTKNEEGEKVENGAQETYINAFRSTLKPYAGQLSQLSIPEDTDTLKQELEKMLQQQEKAKEEGNDTKAEGIQKGIASLQAKIENPKQVPAYDRIMGDSRALERAMRFVELSADALMEQEKTMQTLIENPSVENRKKLIEAKTRNLALEKKFRQDVALLDTKMQSFEETQEKMLTSLIGEAETKKLLAIFHETMLEDRDHIHTDISTLQQLIEDETKEALSLEGTPMNIGVWNRNPDEDLYLGNYTDCCIRIDSDHMGEKSTIADYLTDLGIQVVTARDEKKDIPVVAAWSFIGKNIKTDEVALVIDNIEANTNYSIPFQIQLSEKLKTYFEKYAKSIGIAKIVQGTKNNDIALFEMDGEYVKLGGYNREEGYFLEAEGGDDDDEDDDEWEENQENDTLETDGSGDAGENEENEQDDYFDIENRLHGRKK